MTLSRYLSLLDLTVAIVVLVALALPPRSLSAREAYQADDEQRLRLALAQARSLAAPADGDAAAELTRRLVEVGQLDWAVEAAAVAAGQEATPSRWRALMATSIAHAERLEVNQALA